MEKNIENRWQNLENAKIHLLEIIEKHPIESQRLSKSGKWNMLDNLEHLLITEKGINNFFRKYPPNKSEFNQKLKNTIAASLLKLLYKSNVKVKAPLSALNPSGKFTFPELKLQWDNEREFLRNILESFPKEKAHVSVFKHPVSGGMTMQQTLEFICEHIKRHTRQVRQLENQLRN